MPLREYYSRTDETPHRHGAAVTPSDSVDLAFVTRGVYVGGTGDVTVVLAGEGATVTFKAVPVGTTLRVAATRIAATGTTATNLVALY